MTDWYFDQDDQLADALAEFKREFPGWWLSICQCHLSSHGYCGPDRVGRDAHIAFERPFANGFEAELYGENVAALVRELMRQARQARHAWEASR